MMAQIDDMVSYTRRVVAHYRAIAEAANIKNEREY